MIEILHRYTRGMLYSSVTAADIATTVADAVKSGANLRGANLWGANLEGANLEGANLQDANLRGANLQGAKLEGANLWGAKLEGANLRDAKQRILQIQGSRHQIVAVDDDVRIGCHRKTMAEWLASYEDVGRSERYTPAEIAEYCEHLRHIERVLAMPRG